MGPGEDKRPGQVLRQIAEKSRLDVLSADFAKMMDREDPLREFKYKFAYPKKGTLEDIDPNIADPSDECVYLCGNSLGLKPLSVDDRVKSILDCWANNGVQMHFREPVPAGLCDRLGRESLGVLVGADPSSVVLMNGLTVNLHLLMLSFYQPTAQRRKILIEGHAFPSDRYAMVSQAELKGLPPADILLEINPRPGEHIIRTEDVVKLLQEEGSSIAVVCLSGVQYYTGQKFDMAAITKAGREAGCLVGWDLAHAVGNVSIELDKWEVDFACWCTYKYLNSGPGGIAGAYVNRRHNQRQAPQLRGWWSNLEDTRFQMRHNGDFAPGIDGFRLCNPPPLLVTIVLASLQIFQEAGMPRLLEKQYLLTGYLELLIRSHFESEETAAPPAVIITPSDVDQRGCQLSLMFSYPLHSVHKELGKRGIVCDVRLPNVMRISPVPLYNSFSDVYNFITILNQVLAVCRTDAA